MPFCEDDISLKFLNDGHIYIAFKTCFSIVKTDSEYLVMGNITTVTKLW